MIDDYGRPTTDQSDQKAAGLAGHRPGSPIVTPLDTEESYRATAGHHATETGLIDRSPDGRSPTANRNQYRQQPPPNFASNDKHGRGDSLYKRDIMVDKQLVVRRKPAERNQAADDKYHEQRSASLQNVFKNLVSDQKHEVIELRGLKKEIINQHTDHNAGGKRRKQSRQYYANVHRSQEPVERRQQWEMPPGPDLSYPAYTPKPTKYQGV